MRPPRFARFVPAVLAVAGAGASGVLCWSLWEERARERRDARKLDAARLTGELERTLEAALDQLRPAAASCGQLRPDAARCGQMRPDAARCGQMRMVRACSEPPAERVRPALVSWPAFAGLPSRARRKKRESLDTPTLRGNRDPIMPDSAPSLRPDVLLAQSGWVRGLARALVFDSNRVDDVVQKTWLAALEHPGAEVGNVRAWLAGIVRNVIRQETRSESRRAARERGSECRDPWPPVAELVERADLQKRVVQAVLELEEPHRSTLLLRYFEDLSAGEIARRLGVPGSTVRSRIQAALETLRERFDRERGGDRRAWGVGLIPLMLPRGNAGAALVSKAPTGVLVMTIKGFFVTVLAVGIGFGASYAYRYVKPGSEPAGAPVASLATLHAATRGPAEPQFPALETVAPHQQEGNERQPVAPQEKSVKAPVQVKGRVVDLEGEPAAGVRVFVGGQPSPFEKVEAGLRLSIGHEEERRPARGEPGEEYHEDERARR